MPSLARPCHVFKGHLARFQDGFKPAGPFWVPPPSYLGLGLLGGWTSGLQALISESVAISPSLPLWKPFLTGSVWIVLA